MQDLFDRNSNFLSTTGIYATWHPADVMSDQKKFFVFRSYICSVETQRVIASEALYCHFRNNELNGDQSGSGLNEQLHSLAKSSLKLNLGISCGGDLSSILPNAVAVARRAFQDASIIADTTTSTATTLQLISNGPLSGLSLLYGNTASMLSHYDSPTQPGQREEWLCVISLGNSMMFRCDNEVITIHSGDVIVMDSMAVLHGVERIIPDDIIPSTCTKIGFPVPQARLGILFWQGRIAPVYNTHVSPEEEFDLDGTYNLFDSDGYE